MEVYENIMNGKIDYSLINNSLLQKLIQNLLTIDIKKRFIDSKKISTNRYF